jgi:V/A-type H+-transporting ATPase subunit K
MAKWKMVTCGLIAICTLALLALAWGASASEPKNVTNAQGGVASPNANTTADDRTFWGYIAIGAGLAVGIAGLGTGIAQQGIGAAAVGAIAEDPKFFGRGLILIAIPETVVIFGLLIAFLMWMKMI